ncbi:MAG: hypothetical protein HY554_13735 [Elusimicrobia bacterium]|nr:hypothetical protein [Elusimicrobiota bacterium]
MSDVRFLQLCRAGDAQLERLLAAGAAPEDAALGGWEWRGYNTPPFTALLGIRKFIKGFFDAGAGLEGYNIPAKQNGLDGAWLHRPRPQAPARFGFYRVRRPRAGERDSLYADALLLDYGASARNASYRPERVLRDYLVQPFPDDRDLLLGKAYLAFGPLRVRSNFFVLGRLRPAPWLP